MKLNIHFYILFLVACIASLNDILIYFSGIDYGICIFISIVIVAIINIFLVKKKKFQITIDFNKYDIILFLAMIFVVLIKGIVYPDYIYDVVSYHIYLQKNPFMDKINFDFFPGRIYCIFLFALGDRMFYIFRYFLGYRAGTILSFYLPIVLFYQTKTLLKHFGHNDNKSTFLSYFVFLVIRFSCNIGNYYIDNLMVLFLIEGIIIIFTNKELFNKKFTLYILSLIFGFAVGVKITAIFFIVPLVVYAMIKNKDNMKNIKFYNLLLCIIIFMLPFFIYMLDNFKQTGSVLFPYYNKIFKSEFFELENWKDERFGINGITNKLLWPIIVNVLYKYGDDLHLPDYSWVVRIYFCNCIYNKKCN